MASVRRKSSLNYSDALEVQELDGGHQITVGRAQDGNVVRPLPSKTNHVRCNSSIHPFFDSPRHIDTARGASRDCLMTDRAFGVVSSTPLETLDLNSSLAIKPTGCPFSVLPTFLSFRIAGREDHSPVVRVIRRGKKTHRLLDEHGRHCQPVDLEPWNLGLLV